MCINPYLNQIPLFFINLYNKLFTLINNVLNTSFKYRRVVRYLTKLIAYEKSLWVSFEEKSWYYFEELGFLKFEENLMISLKNW